MGASSNKRSNLLGIPKFDFNQAGGGYQRRVASATSQKKRNESSCNSDGPDGSKDPAPRNSKHGKKNFGYREVIGFRRQEKRDRPGKRVSMALKSRTRSPICRAHVEGKSPETP